MSLFSQRNQTSLKTEFINNVSFRISTPEEIKQIAVKKITTPLTFDPLGHPIPGGLYDLSLGPMNDKSDPCATCDKYISECSGHFGYIELALPVVNPIFHQLIGSILKMTCLDCFSIQIPGLLKSSLAIQMRLLDCGMIVEASDLENMMANVAQKLDAREDIPERVTRAINGFEKLCRKLEENPEENVNLTKNTEQLRKQFMGNIPKYLKKGTNCMFCKHPMSRRIEFRRNRITLSQVKDDETRFIKERVNKYVNPDESKNYLREIWKQESEFLMVLAPVLKNYQKRENPTDLFYVQVVCVPPPMSRPANVVNGRINEHPKTNAYRAILQNNIILNTIIYVMKQDGESLGDLSTEAKDVYKATRGKTAVEKLSNIWESLQSNFDGVVDKDTSKQNEFLGLKQIIEKKQGLMRMHIQGKRVNYSARSVITPDPNLKVDEIGVPDTFAKQLTYPTYVNAHNIEELRQMVMNGPEIHPGATMVESKNGKIVRLDPKNPVQRESVAKRLMTPEEVRNDDYSEQKKVHRHLCNGDILLMNRQPSLHKPSIMAHKARILKGEKTFRLHYANCKAYNADFDGDEMNAHFPQTERARSDAYNLLNVSNQYLVPKDGTPLSGLIQDHVIAGVKLCIRGRFFCKTDYDQLVFQALYHKTCKIKLLPPAILKPARLWSGKQVLSTIIMNIIPDGKDLINLTSTSKIKSKDWQNDKPRPWKAGGTPFEDDLEMSESRVIIKKGELLTGVLDKAHYGATPFGLVHCVYELYGGDCATDLLSSLTRLFTSFLQLVGFTLGVKDILTLQSADRKRAKIVRSLREMGPEIMRKALKLPDDATTEEIVEVLFTKLSENPNYYTAIIDREYKSNLNNFTNKMNSTCMSGLLSKFPDNNLQLMVTSGAKGTTVNTMQISCCLGQIELEGKRPPRMISGKTLPSFPVFDFSPRAGGFIEGRFLTGIQPQEFFFHCMAGREGLVDTAVKTSSSGYLQRCLVKSLEGLQVKPDLTVRDSDNTVVQFLYGQDGMDVGKSQFLSKEHLPFLHENMHAILDKKLVKAESKTESYKQVKELAKRIKEWKLENGSTLSKKKYKPFTLFTQFFKENSNRKVTKDQLIQLWREAGDEVRQSFAEKCQPCPDTLNSSYLPHCNYGSVNERLQDLIDSYDGCKSKKEKKTFEKMIKQKAMTSLCDSGEAVGLLAAQSIGEPSTQMTLNTFHFAGRGEMNVTLGIPRLREILMTASKRIKTPSMVIPFLPIENLQEESELLRKKFNRVTVNEVLRNIEVAETTRYRTGTKIYDLKFNFLKHTTYKKEYCVNPKYIIKHMRKKFFKLMFQTLGKYNKFSDEIIVEDKPKSKRAANDAEDEDGDERMETERIPPPDSDSSDEEPEDETDAKSARKYQELHDDQENDEEDVEMASVDGDEAEDEEERHDDETLEFLDQYKIVDNLTYDRDNYLWCRIVFSLPMKAHFDLPSVMKSVAAKSVIWEVPGINKSITYVKDGVTTLRTDGINISEMSKYDRILDLKKLYCNDIHTVIKQLGLGAGMDAIVKEIQDVFEVYGIRIDPRHLMLISEYMTANGFFEPLNRMGMQSSTAPFQQMSFEASLKFLQEAVIGGKRDPMRNPSSCLTAGVLCDIGSGGIDLMQKIF